MAHLFKQKPDDSVKWYEKHALGAGLRGKSTYAHCNYRSLFDELYAPLIWVHQTKIVDVNNALCNWLGYTAEQLIGAPLRQLAPSVEWRNNGSPWHAIVKCETLLNAEIGMLDVLGNTHKVAVSIFAQSPESPDTRVLLVQLDQYAEAIAMAEAQQSSLAYELTAAEARERRKIANGLHDEIGQVLAIIGLKLAALGTSSSQREIAEQVKELLSFIAQAQQATRSATFELSCPVLQHIGLQAAIESLAERLDGVANLSICVKGSIPAVPIPEPVAQVTLRIVRELLMNAIKHSHARHAWIEMTQRGDELCFTVGDDGIGMSHTSVEPSRSGGYGLHNVEAQIQAIGGRLEHALTTSGTQIEIVLPFPHDPASVHTM